MRGERPCIDRSERRHNGNAELYTGITIIIVSHVMPPCDAVEGFGILDGEEAFTLVWWVARSYIVLDIVWLVHDYYYYYYLEQCRPSWYVQE